jgi:hypothetical protein
MWSLKDLGFLLFIPARVLYEPARRRTGVLAFIENLVSVDKHMNNTRCQLVRVFECRQVILDDQVQGCFDR